MRRIVRDADCRRNMGVRVWRPSRGCSTGVAPRASRYGRRVLRIAGRVSKNGVVT